MAKFCTRCGRSLEENEICQCYFQGTTQGATQNPKVVDINAGIDLLTKWKNDVGIGDPELNKTDAYEKDKQIVPDVVKANESEFPVKQYTLATLRNRGIFGITFSKAIGRLQVTNKRVIFRAPGKSIAGRTTLQHEFAIDEIAGIESRREYVFNFWDIIMGWIILVLGGVISTAFINSLCARAEGILGMVLLTLVIGAAGCIPFLRLKKKWGLKLLCLGASVFPLAIHGIRLLVMSSYYGAGYGFWGGFMSLLALIVLVFVVISYIYYVIKPSLHMVIKTKSASSAIDIRRERFGLFGIPLNFNTGTGYAEIVPEDDAEKSIREIGALINDIQKLGDFGIEKWKA